MLENLILGIGLLTGLLFMILIIILAKFISFRKNINQNTYYDERQVLTRRTAYMVSFYVAMFYMFLCFLLDFFEVKWAMLSMQMIIGFLISFGVFGVMCIFTNSYFRVDEKNSLKKTVTYIVLCVVNAMLNIYIAILNTNDGETFFTDGVLNVCSINLFLGIFFLVIPVALTIKIIAEKIEEKRMVE